MTDLAAGESPLGSPARASQPRLWWLGSLLLFAVLVGVSVLGALARVDQQRTGIEQFLRDRTGLEVRFANLHIQLGFYGPEAVFRDVEFRRPGVNTPLLRAQSVTARFEYFRVLRSGELQPGLITLRDADVYLDSIGVAPAASGRLAAASSAPQALSLLAALERSSFEHAAQFAAALPEARLRFESVALHLRRSPQTVDTWLLQSPLISVDKSSFGLRMVGTVRLPERLGDSVWFRLEAPQQLTAGGTLQLRTRGLAVMPWRELAAISAEVGGQLDLQVDARWSQGRWRTAQSSLLWQVGDSPVAAELQFDRTAAALSVDAPRLSLLAMQTLWRAFDPAAQVLTMLGDLQPQGEVSALHLQWLPQAPLGARVRVLALLHDLQLRSPSANLQLGPLAASIGANERVMTLSIKANGAELRGLGTPVGSGRIVNLDAQLMNVGRSVWTLALRNGSLGPRSHDDPQALDRPLPEITALRGAVRWDLRGPWQGELAGRSAQQNFTLHGQGDAQQALLDAEAPQNWRARLRLQPSSSGWWRTVAGRVELGAARRAAGRRSVLPLPRAREILLGGRMQAADLLTLQSVLTRWPSAAQMPPWRGRVQVSELWVGGQPLGSARIALQRHDAQTVLQITSAPLTGELRLSAQGDWAVELRCAHFAERSANLLGALLAAQSRASVSVADLRYGEHRLGRLTMEVQSSRDELLLQRVSLVGAATLRGGGRCSHETGRCAVRLAVRGDDLGSWMQQLGQGAPPGGPALTGNTLRGELAIEWPLLGPRPWLDSLTAHATVTASDVTEQGSATPNMAAWLAGLSRQAGPGPAGLPASLSPRFERLEAELRWQDRVLNVDSVRLANSVGELHLSGQLDFRRRQVAAQLGWQPYSAQVPMPDALATLESMARQQLPVLASAVSDVGRWVSGSPAPLRWQVLGSMDAPNVLPLVAQ